MRARIPEWLIRTWSGALDICFPRLCPGCREPMTAPSAICWRCIEALRPVGLLDVPPDSTPSSGATMPWFCMWEYGKDGPLHHIVHAMKYGRQPWLAADLGRALATRLVPVTTLIPDAVIPIPLHRVRFLERGYNQAFEIARPVATALGVECLPAALTRLRPTRTQTTLSRDERRSNVQGAFEVSGTKIPSRILLIDDVATTGATLQSAADALAEAGVQTVVAATIGLSKS